MRQGWYVRALLLALCTTTASQAVRPMVSYRALQLDGSTLDVGLIAGSYALLSLFLAVPIGRWVDRIGETRLLLTGTSVVTVVALWLVSVDSLVALGVSQALLGVGYLTGLVGLQTLLASGGPRAARDGRFGLLTVVASVGQMAGPALVGALGGTSGGQYRSVFLAAGALFGGALLLAVTLSARPPREHERHGRPIVVPERSRDAVRSVLSAPSVPPAILVSMAVLSSLDILLAYLPVYGEARGLTVGTVTMLLSVRAGASLASRTLMVPLIRLLGRRRLLGFGTLLPAVALGLLPTTGAVPLLVTLMAVAGFGLGYGQPVSLAWIASQVPVEIRGTAVAIRLTGNRLGQLAVPALVGALAGATGIVAVFVAIGLALGASAVTVLRSPFDDAPGAAPAPEG